MGSSHSLTVPSTNQT